MIKKIVILHIYNEINKKLKSPNWVKQQNHKLKKINTEEECDLMISALMKDALELDLEPLKTIDLRHYDSKSILGLYLKLGVGYHSTDRNGIIIKKGEKGTIISNKINALYKAGVPIDIICKKNNIPFYNLKECEKKWDQQEKLLKEL